MDRFDSMRIKGINTNDATATADDILEGKTAYVAGKKITGVYVNKAGNTDSTILEIYDWCATKGAYMPDERTLENLLECVKSISQITKVTVGFDTGTSEIIQSKTIVYGHPTELPIPTITPSAGKKFDCWLLDGIPITNATPITKDCTLTARWSDVLYLIQDNRNDYVIGYNSGRIQTKFTRANCRSVTFLNDGYIPANVLTSWDVSKENDGSIMAYVDTNNTSSTYNLYISGNGKIFLSSDCNYMFYKYGKGGNIEFNNIEGIDTSEVTNMSYMFSEIGAISMLDLSSFNTENVTDMNHMFADNHYSIKALKVVGFNTKKVTNMSYMFANLWQITSLNLSTFELGNSVSLNGLWYYVNAIQELDISKMDFTGKSKPTAMFQPSSKLTTCKVYCKNEAAKTWLVSNVGFTADNVTFAEY